MLLTVGVMNTYVAAAGRLFGTLAPRARISPLIPFALLAAMLLVPLALDALDVDALMKATSAAFVAVYIVAMAAGVRLLERRSPGRGGDRAGRDARGLRLLRRSTCWSRR